MRKEQNQVKDFMKAAGQDCPEKPMLPNNSVRMLRHTLIFEELGELAVAFDTDNLTETADAITDLLVVVLGCAIACGIDIQPCWDEVHRSNMSKFADGHRREDGKWIKGPSYSPANLKPIIETQQLTGHKVEASALTVNERSDIQMLIESLTPKACGGTYSEIRLQESQAATLRKVLSIL
jgi:predicted HAD superfamily Cof-like phosphohydrolase